VNVTLDLSDPRPFHPSNTLTHTPNAPPLHPQCSMEPWVALIVLVTVSSYVPLTVLITERRGKVRSHKVTYLGVWGVECVHVA